LLGNTDDFFSEFAPGMLPLENDGSFISPPETDFRGADCFSLCPVDAMGRPSR